jgi:hypothetical protein
MQVQAQAAHITLHTCGKSWLVHDVRDVTMLLIKPSRACCCVQVQARAHLHFG